MAAAATNPTNPAASPTLSPQPSRGLGAINRAAATPDEATHTADNAVQTSTAGTLETSTSPAAGSPLGKNHPQVNSLQAFNLNLPSGILSRDDVARQALDVATQALPHENEPPTVKAKLKSRMRRALLRRFVLKMMLGKTLAEWVYPWIHPKGRSRSTM